MRAALRGSAVVVLSLTAALLVAPARAETLGTAAVTAPSFGSAVVVTNHDLGEPGIDVAPDGTLYVNAPAGLPLSSEVFRSDDQGATWQETPADLRAAFPGGGDSDVAVDQNDGTLYMTDLWLGSSTVSSSTDKGETWTANPIQGVLLQDRQWIGTSGDGIVYHATHQIPAGLVVSKSIDGGLTFPLNSIAATPLDQTGCVCPPGTLVVAPGSDRSLGTDDHVGLVYSTSTGGVNFARSTNGGLTFSNVTIAANDQADTTQAFPVVAADGNGDLVAVWLDVFDNSTAVDMSRSPDWGQTWTAPQTLVSSGTSLFPWVDARGPEVAVSVYHTTASGIPGQVPESAQWYETYLESIDGGATFSSPVTVDSTPAKTGPICPEGVTCNGDRELLDFQSVALDGQGHANLAWTRSVDGQSDTQLRFARQQ